MMNARTFHCLEMLMRTGSNLVLSGGVEEIRVLDRHSEDRVIQILSVDVAGKTSDNLIVAQTVQLVVKVRRESMLEDTIFLAVVGGSVQVTRS